MSKNKTFIYSKKFRFDQSNLYYSFQIKRRNWKWLWLLLPLLLIMLLLIRCDREIEISTIEKSTGEIVPNVEVDMHYTSHYLYSNGRFFTSDHEERNTVTDDDGKAKFSELGCSVYSYIFYCLSKASFTIKNDCHIADPDPNKCIFHFTRHKDITLSAKTATLFMEVSDVETHDPLAEAKIIYQYDINRRLITDTLYSNAAGKFELKGAPECGSITFRSVSCYGYEELINMERSVRTILNNPDSAKIALTPLKQSFSYFVKNKFTKEPVPGATVSVTLTSKNGKVIRGKSTTNVDGKGRGTYDDAFILAHVELKAQKTNYKDGFLEGNYTVEQFAELADSLRVVYLEPEPYLEEFQNIDSVSYEPISGVENSIHRSSIDGHTYDNQEISNRNGKFYIKAMEGDQLKIDSDHRYYEPKTTDIEKFAKGKTIEMAPKSISLTFRTVEATDWSLLDDCDLIISTGRGRNLQPNNSGKGEFIVDNLYYGDILSISASKEDYSTNSVTIHQDKVSALMSAPQHRRDIPLNIALPPCNGGESGENNVNAGNISAPQSYNMGVNSGTFLLDYYTGTQCPDQIDVYNHKPGEPISAGNKIWSSGMIITGDMHRTEQITFSKGSVITVIVTTGPESGSVWSYHVFCPY